MNAYPYDPYDDHLFEEMPGEYDSDVDMMLAIGKERDEIVNEIRAKELRAKEMMS